MTLLMRRTMLLLVAAGPALAQAPASIGTATMLPDGTVVLYLVATGPGGAHGHGTLRYPPGNPDREMVLRHLGGLTPGEGKPVPPWPDPPPRR